MSKAKETAISLIKIATDNVRPIYTAVGRPIMQGDCLQRRSIPRKGESERWDDIRSLSNKSDARKASDDVRYGRGEYRIRSRGYVALKISHFAKFDRPKPVKLTGETLYPHTGPKLRKIVNENGNRYVSYGKADY